MFSLKNAGKRKLKNPPYYQISPFLWNYGEMNDPPPFSRLISIAIIVLKIESEHRVWYI